MTEHTKGPWRIMRSTIIADTNNAPNGCSKTDLEAYGGYLIADSILHAPNRALIVSAPNMLKELKLYLETFESDTYAVPIDTDHLKQLISEAEGKTR